MKYLNCYIFYVANNKVTIWLTQKSRITSGVLISKKLERPILILSAVQDLNRFTCNLVFGTIHSNAENTIVSVWILVNAFVPKSRESVVVLQGRIKDPRKIFRHGLCRANKAVAKGKPMFVM